MVSSLVFLLAVCGPARTPGAPGPEQRARERTAFEDLFEAATGGDSEAQTVVGFMLFFGEGVPINRPMAERWFRSAADEGSTIARVNLAIMLHRGLGSDRQPGLAMALLDSARAAPLPGLAHVLAAADPAEANRRVCDSPPDRESRGEAVFETFCAGCHGPNGLALYPGAPSFALGDRMDKPRQELMASVLGGHDRMPSWYGALPTPWLEDALDFVPQLEEDFRGGLLHRLRDRPGVSFNFGPMARDYLATSVLAPYDLNIDLPPEEELCPGPESQP